MSNSSRIEQFIRDNREAFDADQPSPACWAGVEKALDRFPASDALEQFLLIHRTEFDRAEPSEAIWQGIEQTLCPSGPSLEDFIRNNRTAFDEQEPAPQIWMAVEKALPGGGSAKTVHMPWYRMLSRLAAAIALLIAGVGIGIWYAGQQATESGMAMGDLSKEYAELEQYYQRDIAAKQQKLATFAAYQDENVSDDLSQMDVAMEELREELANVPPGNREQVVRAMIENYKAKATILERVLEHLEQQKQPNQQQPAKSNSGNYEVEKI